MMKDQFANYVVQKMIDVAEPAQVLRPVYNIVVVVVMMDQFAKYVVQKNMDFAKPAQVLRPVYTVRRD